MTVLSIVALVVVVAAVSWMALSVTALELLPSAEAQLRDGRLRQGSAP